MVTDSIIGRAPETNADDMTWCQHMTREPYNWPESRLSTAVQAPESRRPAPVSDQLSGFLTNQRPNRCLHTRNTAVPVFAPSWRRHSVNCITFADRLASIYFTMRQSSIDNFMFLLIFLVWHGPCFIAGMGISKVVPLVVLCLLACRSQDACAGRFDVVINGKSHHVNSHYDWNENNLGLGFEYEFDGSSRWIKSVTANTFEDSLENLTYMAGFGLKRRVLSTDRLGGAHVDAGVVVFLMSRKYINDYRPFPGILPAVTVGNRYAGVNLTYLPRKAVRDMTNADIVDPTIGGVFFMQFKFRLPAFGQ